MTVKIPEGLYKKEYTILRMANRKVGLSYRAACSRNIERVRRLKELGLIWMNDNGKERGRFVFRTTSYGKSVLEQSGHLETWTGVKS